MPRPARNAGPALVPVGRGNARADGGARAAGPVAASRLRRHVHRWAHVLRCRGVLGLRNRSALAARRNRPVLRRVRRRRVLHRDTPRLTARRCGAHRGDRRVERPELPGRDALLVQSLSRDCRRRRTGALARIAAAAVALDRRARGRAVSGRQGGRPLLPGGSSALPADPAAPPSSSRGAPQNRRGGGDRRPRPALLHLRPRRPLAAARPRRDRRAARPRRCRPHGDRDRRDPRQPVDRERRPHLAPRDRALLGGAAIPVLAFLVPYAVTGSVGSLVDDSRSRPGSGCSTRRWPPSARGGFPRRPRCCSSRWRR